MSTPMITETKAQDCSVCAECAECGDCLLGNPFYIAAGSAGAITTHYFA